MTNETAELADRVNFRSELASLINHHSMESASNTPDFILATYLTVCLDAFDEAVKHRDAWLNGSKKADPDIGRDTKPEGAE